MGGGRRRETENSLPAALSLLIVILIVVLIANSTLPVQPTLEVIFTPAEFTALEKLDLGQMVCVVFDVLRATSTMVPALANSAAAIIPVVEIPEALSLRQSRPEVLLAGERGGVRIQADLTGSIEFDLGNSPHEFTREKVGGRTIVMTTTNGTRAPRARAPAKAGLLGPFPKFPATSAC